MSIPLNHLSYLRFAKTSASSSLTVSRLSWLPIVIPATLIGFRARLNPLTSLTPLTPLMSGGSDPDLTMVLAGDAPDESDNAGWSRSIITMWFHEKDCQKIFQYFRFKINQFLKLQRPCRTLRELFWKKNKVFPFMQFWSRNQLDKLDWLTPQDV